MESRQAMQCTACGRTNSDSARFCGGCGAPLAQRCAACGAVNALSNRFCVECGTKLSPASATRQTQPAELERRQLTVMFCDMVGSSRLTERLDPEEYGDLLLRYRGICATAIRRYGGFVARYIGDGILAYFGYPQAHDDDARAAVRSALDIVADLTVFSDQIRIERDLEVRAHIGIHTGLVIVSDLSSAETHEASAIVGETPNVAARLQSLAPASTILISATTHELVRNYFDCRPFEVQRLDGNGRPFGAFQVLARKRSRGQLDALRARDLSALEGRGEELSSLRHRWDLAKAGQGQVALISGEPGIGKSRLVLALDEALAAEPHTSLVAYCASHTSHSAFLPVAELIEREADLGGDLAVDIRLRRLETFATERGIAPAGAVPVLARLLSLRTPGQMDLDPEPPRQQRQRTLETLVGWVIAEARRRPTILIVEDIHWADASTIDFLGLLIPQVARNPLLVVLTSRPEFSMPWPLHSHMLHIILQRLHPTHVERMIAGLARRRPLPESVMREVIAKSDGVPLFVEELTKTILEVGGIVEPTIPATLQGSLSARLDNLNVTRLVAQIAATIGREFPYRLIEALWPGSTEELQQNLARLVDAEILFQEGLLPEASFVFKHALLREAAYQTLLLSRRRECHTRIAVTIEERFPALVEAQPEFIAHHYVLGGRPERAAPFWHRAGTRALERSATIEAISHLEKGLDAVAATPPSPERNRLELSILVALGNALIAVKGYAAPEVERAYSRARDLAQSSGPSVSMFSVLRGLQSFYQVRGPLRAARDISRQLLTIAEASGERVLRIEADRRLGWCLFCLGEIADGRRLLEESLALYDATLARHHIVTYGSDPAALGCVNLAWLLSFVGRPGDAEQRSAQAIEHARALGHSLSLAYATGMSAAVHQNLGNATRAAALAREARKLAEAREIPYWAAWSMVIEGWADAVAGRIDQGIAAMRRGLAAYRATGAELFRPYSLGLLADTLLRAGRAEEAARELDDAIASAERTAVHFYSAELHRLRAAALRAAGRLPESSSELQHGLDLGRRQGAHMSALRAAHDRCVFAVSEAERVAAAEDIAAILQVLGPNLSHPAFAASAALAARYGKPATAAFD